MRLQHLENDRISTEAHIQFSELHEKYTAVLSENEELKVLLQKEIEKNTLKTKSTFGRRTEAFLSMLDAADNPEEEPVDESETEDAELPVDRKKRIITFPGKKSRKKKTGGHTTGNGNSLARSLDALPQQLIYDLDVEKLDEKYGRGRWRIAYWHSHRMLMKLSRMGRSASQKDIADALDVSPACVARTLKPLNAAGLIEKTDGSDARRNEINISAAGRDSLSRQLHDLVNQQPDSLKWILDY